MVTIVTEMEGSLKSSPLTYLNKAMILFKGKQEILRNFNNINIWWGITLYKNVFP